MVTPLTGMVIGTCSHCGAGLTHGHYPHCRHYVASVFPPMDARPAHEVEQHIGPCEGCGIHAHLDAGLCEQCAAMEVVVRP